MTCLPSTVQDWNRPQRHDWAEDEAADTVHLATWSTEAMRLQRMHEALQQGKQRTEGIGQDGCGVH